MADRPFSRFENRRENSDDGENGGQIRALEERVESIKKGEQELRSQFRNVKSLAAGLFIVYAPENPTPGVPAAENIEGDLEDPSWGGNKDWSEEVSPVNVYMAQSIYRDGSWGDFKRSRLKGQGGADASQAYLAFPEGDRIKNSEGEILVVARVNEGGDDRPILDTSGYEVHMGDYRLGTDFGEPAGQEKLAYRILARDIDSKADVTLVNPEDQVVFGRTIIDVADGLSGSMRRVEGPLQYTRPSGGNWQTGETVLEGAFRKGGKTVDKTRVSVRWDGSTFLVEKRSGGATVKTNFGERSVTVDLVYVDENGAREVASQSVGAVASGAPGKSSTTYSIHAPEGKAIRNSAGSLPLNVIQMVGDTRERVARGPYALHTKDTNGDYHLLTSTDSVAADSNYQPTLTQNNIQGGLTVYLVNRQADTVSDTDVVDAVRLSDITDSFAGVVSVVEGQGAYYQGSSGGWQTGTTTIKAEFYQGTNLEGRSYIDVTWDENTKSVSSKPDLTPLSGAENNDLYKVDGTSTFWKLDTSRTSPGTDEVGWDPDGDSTYEGVWTDTERATDHLFTATKEPADQDDYKNKNQISISAALGDDLGDDEGQVADVSFSFIYAPPSSVDMMSDLESVPNSEVSDGDQYLTIETETLWKLDTSRTSPGTDEVGWDPDGDSNYEGVWTETTNTPITIVGRETVNAITSGNSATQRHIRPTDGMVIRNADPNKTLGLEVVEKTGDSEAVLTSGDYKLHYKDSNDDFQLLSSLDSTLDNYAPALGAEHISGGDLDVYLRDTGEGATVDSISLADVTDAYGAHYVETPDGREVTYYTVNEGTGAPIDPSGLVLTGVFEPPGEGRSIKRQDVYIAFGETSGDAVEVTDITGDSTSGNVVDASTDVEFAVFNGEATKVYDTDDGTNRLGTSDVQDPDRMRAVFSMIDTQTDRAEQVEEIVRFVDDPSAIALDPIDGTAIKNGSGTLRFDVRKRDQNGERRLEKPEIDDSAGATFAVELDLGGSTEIIDGSSGRMADGSGDEPSGRIVLDETDIDGDDALRVKKGTGVLSAQRLIDVDDGTDGADAISMSLSRSPEDLVYRWNRENASWNRTTDTTIDASVYRGATQIASGEIVVTLDEGNDELSTKSSTTDSGLSVSTFGEDTGSLGIEFTYDDGGSTYGKGENVVVVREGKNAKVLRLVPESYVFQVDKSGAPVPSSIDLAAEAQNISNTPTWSTENGNLALNSTTGSASSLNYSELDDEGVDTATVTVEADGLSDKATLIIVREGSDSVRAVVGNSNHTFPADEDEQITVPLSEGNTRIEAYEGATKLPIDTGGAAESFDVVVNEGPDMNDGVLSKTDGNLSASYKPGAINAESAAATAEITVVRADGTTDTTTRELSYSKAIAGTDARSVVAEAPSQVFRLDSGGNYAPNSITVTAKAQNISSPSYTWSATNTSYSDTGDETTVTPDDLDSGRLALKVTEDGGLFGTVTIVEVASGENAFTVVPTNATHALSATPDGIVNGFDGADVQISAYEGATKLDYDGSGTPAAGTFNVTAAISDNDGSGSADLSGTASTSDENGDSVDDAWSFSPSSMEDAVDSAQITLTVDAVMADGTTRSTEKEVSYTKVRQGSAPRIEADGLIFRRLKNGDYDPGTITLYGRATRVDDPTFEWDKGASGSVDATVDSLGISASELSGGTLTVEMTEVQTGETDTVTLVEVEEGADSVQTVVTNGNHTYPADEDGNITVSLTDGSTDITAYEGDDQLAIDTASTPATETFDVSVTGETGLSGTLSKTDGNSAATYVPDDVTADLATVTLNISVKRADGTVEDRARTATYSKANAGADPRRVVLDAPSQVFLRALDGDYSPQAITLSAESANIDSPSYSWTSANTGYSDSGTETTITPADLDSEGRIQLTVTEDGTGEDDSITVVEVEAGSAGLTAVVSNPSHTFPATPDGVVDDFDGGKSKITVYEGATQLDYDDGSSPANGTFSVSASISDNNGNGTDDISGDVVTSSTEWIFDPTSMDAVAGSAQVTATINAVMADGSARSITRQISYSKAYAGSGAYIEPSSLVFKLTENGNHDPPSITLYGRAPAVNGPSYTWDTDQDGTFGDKTGDSISVSPSDLSGGDTKITMKETETGRTDTVTITEIEAGTDAVQTVVTNENHTFEASADGVVSNPSGGNSDIVAYHGSTRLGTGSGAETFDVTATTSNINGSIVEDSTNDKFLFELDASSPITAAEGSVDLQITPVLKDGTTGATITRTISYSRVTSGDSSRIEAGGFTFVKDNEQNYSPQDITLTGRAPDVSAPTFSWTNESGATSLDPGSDTSTLTVTPSDLNSSGELTIKMTVDQTGYTDTATIVSLEEGADSVRSVLTNENHTYPADKDGNIKDTTSPSAGKSDIRAYEGSNQLPISTSGGTGTYEVSVVSETNISGTLSQTDGENTATYTPSSVSDDAASVDLEITVTTAAGNVETISRTIAYSKAREGNEGQNAITISLSNTNHTYTKVSGDVSTPSNGKCEIRMYEGAALLSLNSAKVLSVTPGPDSINPPDGDTDSDYDNAVTIDSSGTFAVYEPTGMPGEEVQVTVAAEVIVDGQSKTRTGTISYSTVNKQRNDHTVTDADPSGGADGDVWFKVSQDEKSSERYEDVGHFQETSAPADSDGENGDVWFEV